MNDRIFIFANMTKPGSAGVLERAERIASGLGLSVRTYTDPRETAAAASEEPPRCIVTIGGDGTVLRTVSALSLIHI